MQKINAHALMQQTLAAMPKGERLLLHSCCAPCSSAVLEQLAAHCRVTLLYANPNIWPEEEYIRRRDEQRMLLQKMPLPFPVEFAEQPYDHAAFLRAVAGLESQPEGGARCAACFRLRLAATATEAKKRGIKWVGTTLSVSPHKNAALLNELGGEAAGACNILYLPADFKKQDGYLRSLQLSAEYGLYRQQYCGCEFSAGQNAGE